MKFLNTCWVILPFVALIAACSDTPTGKFKDDKKTQTDDALAAGQTYIHNAAATQWQSDWSKDNVVVFQWKGEPDNLHPTNGLSNARTVIQQYTQRALLNIDYQNLKLCPDLAKSLPQISPDGLRYTYELRNDPIPTWDDGTPLTVKDIVFSFKANVNPFTNNDQIKPYFGTLADIETDPSDPLKFTLVMKRKYIQNEWMVAGLPIMEENYYDPQHVLEKYSVPQLTDPNFIKTTHKDLQDWSTNFNDPKYGHDLNYLTGLGAYKVTAWEAKDRIELTKKPNHWTSKVANPGMLDVAYPQKIIFKIITDNNGIVLGLKQQSIDASTWISTQDLIDLQKDPIFTRNYHSAFISKNFNYSYMGMNMKPEAENRLPFFTDKRVRHAMALLVPVDKINQAYFAGKAERMASLVVPSKPSELDPKLKPVAFDIEKAKQLLDEAGWKDTDGDNIRDKMIDGKKVQFSFELLIISGDNVTENAAKDISDAMYQAGIKVNVRPLEFVTFYQQVEHEDFDMYWGAWAGSVAPDDPKQIWASDSWPKGSNYVGFGTPESDALIDSIRYCINDTQRYAFERKLEDIVYDEQPYIFMYVTPIKAAIHKRFTNADMYFEKPWIIMNNLKLLSQSNAAQPAAVN